MILDLMLQCSIDDPTTAKVRMFTKEISANAPHVPRVGEAVVIPAGSDGFSNIGARRVEDVIYTFNERGTVVLVIKLDGLYNDVETQVEVLRRAGFIERRSS